MRRHRGAVDVKGHVLRPNQITRKKAKLQISMVHDYFMDTCAGIIADQYEYYISNIKKIFNRRLYKQLRGEIFLDPFRSYTKGSIL